MPPSKSDTRLLLTATLAVLVAGVVVAVVLLFATGRSGSPPRGPFPAGLASAIRSGLQDEGPYYVPDPNGRSRSILFALENGKVVALATQLPGTTDCFVKWRAALDRFVDCRGVRHTSEELDRYESYVDPDGENKGILFVDLRHKIPAPQVATSGG